MGERATRDGTEETSRSAPERERRVRTPFLVIGFECDRPLVPSSRHALDRVDEVTVGRGAERKVERTFESGRSTISIRLADRRLSGRHARFVRDGAGWVLEDLDSTNGSFVAGQRIERRLLVDGDVIELGRTLFVYREMLAPRGVVNDYSPDPDGAAGFTTLNPELAAELERVRRIAASPVPLLVFGETGTGKEVLARSVHELSKRPGEFVAVNCGAIPEALVESQLFGHVKGAFSGAVRDELGFVRAANYGTLFLDEIGDLPRSSQVALLRVLQSGEVTPLGSAKSLRADIRVLGATHRSLTELMDRGEFRRDLYARLAGFIHTIPPLRERREDFGLVTSALLSRLPNVAPDRIRLRVEAARALYLHAWPLNVRELEQTLLASSVLAEDGVIAREHLPASVAASSEGASSSIRRSTERPLALSAEDARLKDELEQCLGESAGNLSEVARRMGKARQQVQRWIKRFGLDPSSYR
jgi:DNA-binding NtrC family response regulator